MKQECSQYYGPHHFAMYQINGLYTLKLIQCCGSIISPKKLEKNKLHKNLCSILLPRRQFSCIKLNGTCNAYKALVRNQAKSSVLSLEPGSVKIIVLLAFLTPGQSCPGNKRDQNTSLGSSCPVWMKPHGCVSLTRVRHLGLSKRICTHTHTH